MGGAVATNGADDGTVSSWTETAAPKSPALQVIVLGSGGGPQESNTTAFLVRPLASGWRKSSLVALDAGVHLSAITRILEETQPGDLGKTVSLPHTLTSGPFKGLEVHSASAAANASHIHRTLIETYLITHPHLDHISGFVINTAGLPGSRPKRLAGLPSTISAFKTHIFNNVIWPNLSDENNGAGLVTYMRLMEGGSPALGEGDGKGYVEISDGLAVKVWSVSHGHCIERHSHRGSGSSTRYGSVDGSSLLSPRSSSHHHGSLANPALANLLQMQTPGANGTMGGSGGGGRSQSIAPGDQRESVCVYDSSAYFIRDVATGREVLMFGDVEPDSISLSPRNGHVWAEAAPKVASGALAAIFVECSYDDSQGDDRLFGHLAPRYVMEEMRALAAEVEAVRATAREATRKRKRDGAEDGYLSSSSAAGRRKTALGAAAAAARQSEDPVSPRTVKPLRVSDADTGLNTPHIATPTAELSLQDAELNASLDGSVTSLGGGGGGSYQLKGLKVVIIHMKDKLVDGPQRGDVILGELTDYEREAQLGCEFIISGVGQELYF